MFGKLIKHEFRATGRIMLPMLLVLLVLAVLANVSFILIDNVNNGFLNVLLGLLIAAFFVGVFAVGVITVVIMVMRFYRNLLGDQGYMMMTLPTNVHSLVWSKLIVSLVWFVVAALVIIAALGGTGLNLTNMDIASGFEGMPSLAEIIAAISEETGLSVAGLWGMGIEFVILIIAASLSTCLHFYAAMSIGHCFANRKVLLSIVFYVVISIAIQIFSSAVAVGAGMSMDHMISQMRFEFFAYALHFVLGLVLVEGTAMYFATVLPLKKGLNLA